MIESIRRNNTPLELVKYRITIEFFRPYNAAFDIVLEQYDSEQRKIIQRSRNAQGDLREELLAETIGDSDEKLVATFNSQVRTIRQNMRQTDPELDAWLLFFDKVDTARTERGNDLFNNLILRMRNQGVESLIAR